MSFLDSTRSMSRSLTLVEPTLVTQVIALSTLQKLDFMSLVLTITYLVRYHLKLSTSLIPDQHESTQTDANKEAITQGQGTTKPPLPRVVLLWQRIMAIQGSNRHSFQPWLKASYPPSHCGYTCLSCSVCGAPANKQNSLCGSSKRSTNNACDIGD